MTPCFDVTVQADCFPHRTSYVFAGLFDLQAAGQARVRVVYPWSRSRNEVPEGESLWMEVHHPNGKEVRTICYDHADHRDRFEIDRLERCDVYYKRNYDVEFVRALPQCLQFKVRPFGLYYPCRSSHDASYGRRTLAFFVRHRMQRWRPIRNLRLTKSLLTTIREHYQAPALSQRYVTADTPVEERVLFQSRVWDPMRISDKTETHEHRAQLVRALRRQFGTRFVGGLVPNSFVRKRYPDCISRLPTNRRSYLRLVASSLVGVSVRGLHLSIPNKLGEYLAHGICVVSELQNNELPAPLKDGHHCLQFKTVDQCVEACDRLLTDTTLAQQMRQHNVEYYLCQVHPAIKVGKMLHEAFAECCPGKCAVDEP